MVGQHPERSRHEVFLSEGKRLLALHKFAEANYQFRQLVTLDDSQENLFWLRFTDVLAGHPSKPLLYGYVSIDQMKQLLARVFAKSHETAKILIEAAYNQAVASGESCDSALVQLAGYFHPNLNPPGWKGNLELKGMDYCSPPEVTSGGFKFVLSYQDWSPYFAETCGHHYGNWVIQVFRDIGPFVPDLGRERPKVIDQELQNWQAVNLKVPTKGHPTSLTETTWIIPRSINVTPLQVMTFGFDDRQWQKIGYRQQPWPDCFSHFIDQYAIPEIKAGWSGPHGYDESRRYRDQRVDR